MIEVPDEVDDEVWLAPVKAARVLGTNSRQLPVLAIVNSVRVRVLPGSHLRYHEADIRDLAARSGRRAAPQSGRTNQNV